MVIKMIQKPLYILLFVSVLLSCTGKRHVPKTTIVEATPTEETAELALPTIPPTLTSPETRAAYLTLHFWDAMDFTNHALSLDTMFMELNFANYLSVFPVVTQEADRNEAMKTLLQKAAHDSEASAFLIHVADKYLGEPNSPMRDEELLIVFYQQLTQTAEIPEWQKERARNLLHVMQKNRPGMRAADFAYTDRNNRRNTLHATQSADFMLLVFYDPECEHCKEIIGTLAASELLTRLQAEGRLTVLAVDTESDAATWNKTKTDIPQAWTVAKDESRIVERTLYSLPEMPVIYLLDKDKKVLLKAPTPDALEAYLQQD